MASSWSSSWGTSWGSSWDFVVSVDAGSDYSTIPIHQRYSRIPLKKKKKKDELAELAEHLRAVAAATPKPEIKQPPPAVFTAPLASPFFEKSPISVKPSFSRDEANARYEQLLKRRQDDEDEEIAVILLMH